MPLHQMNSAFQYNIKDHLDEAPKLFQNSDYMMPIAPSTNKIFGPKPQKEPEDFIKVASTINAKILDSSLEALNMLVRKEHVLLGGDKSKDQFTMRGHMDDLEKVVNDMVTELKYHR